MSRLPMLFVIAASAVSAGCARPSPPPATGQLVTAEVPPALIEQARADLAQHAGIAASDATLVRAQSIVWPNGALGCEQPGQMYTQMTVPGYVVELEDAGRVYSYHAAKEGGIQRCDDPTTKQGVDVR